MKIIDKANVNGTDITLWESDAKFYVRCTNKIIDLYTQKVFKRQSYAQSSFNGRVWFYQHRSI